MPVSVPPDPDEGGAAPERAARYRALGDPHRLAIVDALRHTDLTASELAQRTGLRSNLLAFHLRVLDDAGLVRRVRSEGDGRRRYVHRTDAVPDDAVTPPLDPSLVLFVCTRNASRSQLAAALWTQRTGRPALSAGREPASRVDEPTRRLATHHGLDLADAQPRGYDAVDRQPDLLVTVCDRAGEAALPVAGVPRLHWSVPDPVGRDAAALTAVHADLQARIERLARDLPRPVAGAA